MATTLAFDVYGTLIDTNGVVERLRRHVGNRAPAFARSWREKQLEYAFRRAVMGCYADFSVCISDALEFALRLYSVSLTAVEREKLLASYQCLPAFLDAEPGLEVLQRAGYRAFAFSNGSREAVSKLLGDSALRPYVNDIVSVEEVETFKPSPSVYAHFLRQTGAVAEQTWLISSNPFDVVGAVSAGWKAVWVRRLPDVIFDSWGIEPTASVSTLTDLSRVLPEPE